MKKLALSIAGLALLLMPLSSFAQKPLIIATSPIWIVMVTPTLLDPNGVVPTFDGVPGAGVANLDIGLPQSLLLHGNTYVYGIVMQDLNFTGTCQSSFKLTQVQGGVAVTLDSHTGITFSCSPTLTGGIHDFFYAGVPIPNSPGLATLTGTIKYGKKSASLHTTVLLM